MVTYGYESIDDGSDMDVSSGDEGPEIPLNNKLPHEGLVRDLQSHIKRQEDLAQPIQPQVECFIPNNSNYSVPNSYALVASAAAADNNVITVDGDSDEESESSFHTAPSSPMSIDQEPGEIDETDDLRKEYVETLRLMQETEDEVQRIRQQIKEKEDRREALRLKMLRYEVRSSIKRNRQSTLSIPSSAKQNVESLPMKKAKAEPEPEITPIRKSRKGKERATEPFEEEEEEGEIVEEDNEEGEIVEEHNLLSTTLNQIAQNVQQQQQQQQWMLTQFQEQNKKQKQKRKQQQQQQLQQMELQQRQQRASDEIVVLDRSPTPSVIRSDAFNEYIKVMKSRLESNDPESIPFPDISSLTTSELRKLVVQSHLLGNVSILQMKIQLWDLKHRAEKDKLNRYQEANVHCLVKRLIKNSDKPNFHIPTANQEKKKKSKNTYALGPQPTKRLLLGPEFYGNPNLHYDGFVSYNDDMIDRALFYFKNDTQKFKTVVPLDPNQAVPRIMFRALENRPQPESANELRAAIISELQNALENEVKPFLFERGVWKNVRSSKAAKLSITAKLDDIEAARELLGLPNPALMKPKYKTSTSPPLKSILKKSPTAHREPPSFASSYPSDQNNVPNPFGFPSGNTTPFVPPALPQLPPASSVKARHSTRPFLPNMQPQQSTPTNQPPSIRPLLPNTNPRATLHDLFKAPTTARPLLPNINPRANLDDLFKVPTPAPSNSNHAVNSSTANGKTASRPAVLSPSSSTPVVSSSSTPVVAPSASSVTHTSSVNFRPYQSPLSAMGITSVPETKPKAHASKRQLCNAESSGGVCRDKNCPHAHFSDF